MLHHRCSLLASSHAHLHALQSNLYCISLGSTLSNASMLGVALRFIYLAPFGKVREYTISKSPCNLAHRKNRRIPNHLIFMSSGSSTASLRRERYSRHIFYCEIHKEGYETM